MIKWIALGVVAVMVLLFIFLPVAAWIILGLVLLILALVLFIPIGADVAYIGGAFSLAARVDGFALQLYPRKPADPNKPKKEKKPKKPKEEKPPEEAPPEKEKKPRKLDFSKEEILELLQKALRGLGKFGKLTVRKFMLHYTAAGEDPYNTAMTYGYVNAALSTLAPVCAETFRVTGDVDVRTDVDFTAENMRIDAALSMTLRLVQLVRAALAVAFGALGVLIKHKLRVKKEARLAKKAGISADSGVNTVVNTENTETEINQAEERNDLHG